MVKISIKLWIFGCLICCRAQPVKRQVSIDDLIHSALTLVRPIFDTSQVAQQESPVIPRKLSMTEHAGRETSILGAPKYSSIMEVPICRGNSQICRFISCTAHNFKHDDNFANLNLAAQLMGDKKMRKVIGSNPEAVGAVCREQGMSAEQCKLFSRGFQLIDNFMSKIEKPSDSLSSNTLNEADDPTLKPLDDDNLRPSAPQKHVVDLSIPRNTQMGSHTWSTHRRTFDNPKPMKQVIRHSTTNRSQPLGITEAPRKRRPPTSPPRAQMPPNVDQPIHIKTTTRYSPQKANIPPRPRKLPELEEEEDFDYISEEDDKLARPRRSKRADSDYYDQLGGDKSETPSISSPQEQKTNSNKMNCIQYLGGI